MTTENPTQPAIPPDVLPLVEQIDELLEANGKVPQATKDTLMFSVIKSMVIQMNGIETDIKTLSKIEGRVAVLEKRNIVSWATTHPAVSIFFITLIMLLLFQHYGMAILNYLGVKVPIVATP